MVSYAITGPQQRWTSSLNAIAVGMQRELAKYRMSTAFILPGFHRPGLIFDEVDLLLVMGADEFGYRLLCAPMQGTEHNIARTVKHVQLARLFMLVDIAVGDYVGKPFQCFGMFREDVAYAVAVSIGHASFVLVGITWIAPVETYPAGLLAIHCLVNESRAFAQDFLDCGVTAFGVPFGFLQ